MVVQKSATASLKSQEHFLFLWPFHILLLEMTSAPRLCGQWLWPLVQALEEV